MLPREPREADSVSDSERDCGSRVTVVVGYNAVAMETAETACSRHYDAAKLRRRPERGRHGHRPYHPRYHNDTLQLSPTKRGKRLVL